MVLKLLKQTKPKKTSSKKKILKKAPPKKENPNGPRILFVDIETAPTRGWVWRAYEDNLLKTDHDWYMLSFAYKWAHEDDFHCRALPDYPEYFKKNRECDKELINDLWKLFNEADIIIGHNGDQFDIKKSNARFIIHNLEPPSAFKTVDTLKVARRHFKFNSNKLNDLGTYLGVGVKLPHTGSHLWFSCMENTDPDSWKLMKQYNVQDVRLLEKVYYRIRPWITNHPNIHLYNEEHGNACPKCGSFDVIKKGFTYTLKTKRQQFQCRGCHGWFTGGPPIKKPDPVLALFRS